jgi:hypothetical protein
MTQSIEVPSKFCMKNKCHDKKYKTAIDRSIGHQNWEVHIYSLGNFDHIEPYLGCVF